MGGKEEKKTSPVQNKEQEKKEEEQVQDKQEKKEEEFKEKKAEGKKGSEGAVKKEVEDEEEDSEEEEEEEPKLKYERVCGDLRDILKRDAATCIAANSKLIIVGTSWGRIHVLDHQGNKVREFAPHNSPVTQLDLDANGDYIASCCHDRRVVVQGLYTSENSHTLVLEAPVRCVTLDPMYYKPRSGRRFVVGTTKLILYEKALFGQLRSSVLAEGGGAGPVRAMRWAGQFLAWATDSGVRVTDMATKSIITLIKRDHSLALPGEQYLPHLCWANEQTLMVGWGDSIKVCRVRVRSTPHSPHLTPAPVSLPLHYLEIVFMFTTDFYVCGLGPLDEHVVVLAYNKHTDRQQASLGLDSRRPQIRVLEPLQGTFEELSMDVLETRGYQEYLPANYHLECLVEDKQFYIVCPQDIVVAKPRSADDRMEWLLEHNKYAEALELVRASREVRQHTVLSVGQAYIDHLMSVHRYQEAAKMCTEILGQDKALWEQAVVWFNRARQLRVLSPHLPQGEGLYLDPAVYQTVLLDLLHSDHQGFLQVVQQWSGHLYNVPYIINAVLELLARNTNNLTLLRALAHLYSNIDKHDKALAIYLKLKHTGVFALIGRHNLYSCVAKHVVDLMTLDAAATLEMCVQHTDAVPPESVTAPLTNHQEYLYKYLDALYEHCRDLSKPYHTLLISLYADWNRPKLLPLLLHSSSYDLEAALRVCQSRCLTVETIHLLDRTGNSQESLRLILEEQQDLPWAIRLCKEHDDVDLWGQLINYSLDKPECIRQLLNNIGTHIDPLLIVQRIPEGMEIPGLRDALVKILHDYHLQIELRTGCQHILVADGSNLLKKKVAAQNVAVPVYRDTECAACNKKVLNHRRGGEQSSVVVFACRHVYHQLCVPEDAGQEQEVCLVCRNDKRRNFLTF